MLLNLFQRQPRNPGILGVSVTDEGIALAHVRREAGGPPRLLHAEFQPLGPDEQAAEVLHTRLRQLDLEDVPAATALSPGEFTLQMVPAPEVPPEERRQAVRWRLRDSLPYDVEEAVVDVFEIPSEALRSATPMLYAVIAPRWAVQARIDLLEDAGANLQYIDIPEMAQRNITALLPEDAKGLAGLSFSRETGLLTLTRQAALYLARELEQGEQILIPLPERLEGTSGLTLEGPDPELQRAYDSIVLEVQRSLDYYESHFTLPPIQRLAAGGRFREMPGLAEALENQLGLGLVEIDFNALLASESPLDASLQARCHLAIGLALRDEAA